jgi:hypothetical protein
MDIFQNTQRIYSGCTVQIQNPTNNSVISIHEHGHMWDIFQENYIRFEEVSNVTRASESFSDLQMITTTDMSYIQRGELESHASFCIKRPRDTKEVVHLVNHL